MLIRRVTIKVDGQQKALSFYTSPLSSGFPFEPERDRTYGQCRAPGTLPLWLRLHYKYTPSRKPVALRAASLP